MTDKEAVLDALSRLPESASLQQIAEEIEIMTAVRRSRAESVAGQVKSHSEVKAEFETWAEVWTSSR